MHNVISQIKNIEYYDCDNTDKDLSKIKHDYNLDSDMINCLTDRPIGKRRSNIQIFNIFLGVVRRFGKTWIKESDNFTDLMEGISSEEEGCNIYDSEENCNLNGSGGNNIKFNNIR
jgi:hypothetical protein